VGLKKIQSYHSATWARLKFHGPDLQRCAAISSIDLRIRSS
jgi:hypothetical protein